MLSRSRSLLKKGLEYSPVALTRNQQYDRQAKRIMKAVLTPASNCVDVGAHEGVFLDQFLLRAPQGHHFAFEPIPEYARRLEATYGKSCHVQELALSDKNGTSSFNLVTTDPAYSGLKKRQYDKVEEDRTIQVKTARLDDMLPPDLPIRLIKIDVEGGEYQVLKGARQILERSHPYVIFEHGLGAADIYGTHPEQVYELLKEVGLHVSLMKDWLKDRRPLSALAFQQAFETGSHYYFLAHPANDRS